MIQLLIGLSLPRIEALKTAGLPTPQAIMADFLIDTGASCTVIDEKLLHPLGLTPTGKIQVATPTTGSIPESRNQYDVGMMLYHVDNSRMFSSLPIIGTDFSGQNIDGLLGRDVLSKCMLVYNGSSERFALAF